MTATLTNGTINGNGHMVESKTDNNDDKEQTVDTASYQRAVAQERVVTVDLCPSCGGGSLVFEESCKKCYSCGYSEC